MFFIFHFDCNSAKFSGRMGGSVSNKQWVLEESTHVHKSVESFISRGDNKTNLIYIVI